MVTSLMLVDDHAQLREALVFALSLEPDLEVVAAVGSADLAVAAAHRVVPDVVLMDVHMPGVDGLAATRTMLGLFPGLRVVMLSAACSRELVAAAMGAGASGYLLKGDEPARLAEALRAVAGGGHAFSPLAAQLLG